MYYKLYCFLKRGIMNVVFKNGHDDYPSSYVAYKTVTCTQCTTWPKLVILLFIDFLTVLLPLYCQLPLVALSAYLALTVLPAS